MTLKKARIQAFPHVTTWDISQVPSETDATASFSVVTEKGTDQCLQIVHFKYFIAPGQLGISFNTSRWSDWNAGSTCFRKRQLLSVWLPQEKILQMELAAGEWFGIRIEHLCSSGTNI